LAQSCYTNGIRETSRDVPEYTYGCGTDIYKALNLGKNEWYDVALDGVE